MTMTADKTYNGWTNYETWNVALWLSNDEGTYNYVRGMAEEAGDEYRLGTMLEEYVDEMRPDLGASMFADLLGAALSEVRWIEIARTFISED